MLSLSQTHREETLPRRETGATTVLVLALGFALTALSGCDGPRTIIVHHFPASCEGTPKEGLAQIIISRDAPATNRIPLKIKDLIGEPYMLSGDAYLGTINGRRASLQTPCAYGFPLFVAPGDYVLGFSWTVVCDRDYYTRFKASASCETQLHAVAGKTYILSGTGTHYGNSDSASVSCDELTPDTQN